jgi:hypothetical protein
MPRRYLLLALVTAVMAGLYVAGPWPGSAPPPSQTAAASPAGAAASAPAATGTSAPPDISTDQRLSRYGVSVVDGDPRQVAALGLRWFIVSAFADDAPAPPGTTAVRFMPIDPPMGEADLRDRVRKFPGTYWLIGNEPNVPDMTFGGVDPGAYADALNYYAQVIKDADPTAKLVGPNVLNWSFVCDGCPGYPEGKAWTQQMRDTYVDRYGAEPPLDVWALHTYELDWVHLPNGNPQRDIDQIQGMRDWLDADPALAGATMWITEMGIHWGYPGMEWQGDVAQPIGDFDYDHTAAFMRDLFGWLNDNADALHIERWFLYPISTTIHEPYQSQWTGITLMDGSDADAPINRLGRLYQQLAGVQ